MSNRPIDPSLPPLRRWMTANWTQFAPLTLALLIVLLCAGLAIIAGGQAKQNDPELQKMLYNGAGALLFGGFLGGILKLMIDDVLALRKLREAESQFVANVLADLKSVHDRVARGRIVISASRTAAAYGDEMRGIIDAGCN